MSESSAKDDGDVGIVRRTQHPLGEFSLASEPGGERQAVQQVVDLVRDLHLPSGKLERLKTAVGEATMNAMEHGNHYRADLAVDIRAWVEGGRLCVAITDRGGSDLDLQPEAPDLDAKLAGQQSPRGWGFFLIENMVDEVRFHRDGSLHTVELVIRLP